MDLKKRNSRNMAHVATCMSAALICVSFMGCRLAPDQNQSLIDIVKSQAIVLPTVTKSASSAFPINHHNVIAAAHSLEGISVISVAGFPHRPFLRKEFIDKRDRKRDEDWVVLSGFREIWHYNAIETAPELKPGNVVFVAGFPAADLPDMHPITCLDRDPTVLQGHLLPHHPSDPINFWRVALPKVKMGGFSGSPVLILDEAQNVKVIGVFTSAIHRQNRAVGCFITPTLKQWRLACHTIETDGSDPGPIIRKNFDGTFPAANATAAHQHWYLPPYLRSEAKRNGCSQIANNKRIAASVVLHD